MNQWVRWATLLVLAVATIVTNAYSKAPRESGMRGPDFDFGQVMRWQLPSDDTARLTLGNASEWKIKSSDPLFGNMRAKVELAQRHGVPLFVSGDRHTGYLNGVALPEKLIPAFVADEPVDGKLVVAFHGPPTSAYLRTDRPWFSAARERLLASLAQESPRSFAPELLVTIDVVTQEIMDVREP